MSVHEGHRERLKDRFLESGLDSFNEINTLELLLFYSIPRKDTNEIAHGLIDQFGSLQAVLDAPVAELVEVEGVGEHTALLLKLVTQVTRKGLVCQEEKSGPITTSRAAGKYFIPRFIGERDEVLYLLCLDAQKRVICCREMSRGVVNSVEVNIRKIVETALRYKASSAILAHNHPSGIAAASAEDDRVTRQARISLQQVNILLVDHIIVVGNSYVSYADTGLLIFGT